MLDAQIFLTVWTSAESMVTLFSAIKISGCTERQERYVLAWFLEIHGNIRPKTPTN